MGPCEGVAPSKIETVDVLVTATVSALATHVLAPEQLGEATFRANPAFCQLELCPEDVDLLLAKAATVRHLVAAMTQ